jgi:hypothetical protein
VTCCAPARNSAHWQAFLARLEQANPTGTIAVITDNLSSHSSLATRDWLTRHPRIEQVFIPKGACWLQPAGGLVADLSPARPGRADLRRPDRDRYRHRRGYRAAQRPRQAVGLGTTSATTTTSPALLYLPALRNAALGLSQCAPLLRAALIVPVEAAHLARVPLGQPDTEQRGRGRDGSGDDVASDPDSPVVHGWAAYDRPRRTLPPAVTPERPSAVPGCPNTATGSQAVLGHVGLEPDVTTARRRGHGHGHSRGC